nr:DUF3951 domain-containing protein [Lihuaxuella thermophila]
MVAFTMFLLFAFGIIIYKRFIQRKAVSVSYTPFDYITGQKSKEFHNDHEENEESTQ